MSTSTYLILLADIHANEAALRAVVEHARQHYAQAAELRLWFLGDLFGRGPEPVRTWQRLNHYAPEVSVVGNHDWMLTGRLTSIPAVPDVLYGPHDQAVLLAHRAALVGAGLLTIGADGMPNGGPVYEAVQAWPSLAQPLPGVYLIHGGATPLTSPGAPSEVVLADMIVDGYVTSEERAAATVAILRSLTTRPEVSSDNTPPCLIIVGHYHRRTLYRAARDEPWETSIQLDTPYELQADAAYPALLSPGGVGFPREDCHREPSYAALCVEGNKPIAVTFHAVPYKRDSVRAAMALQGYPPQVIANL